MAWNILLVRWLMHWRLAGFGFLLFICFGDLKDNVFVMWFSLLRGFTFQNFSIVDQNFWGPRVFEVCLHFRKFFFFNPFFAVWTLAKIWKAQLTWCLNTAVSEPQLHQWRWAVRGGRWGSGGDSKKIIWWSSSRGNSLTLSLFNPVCTSMNITQSRLQDLIYTNENEANVQNKALSYGDKDITECLKPQNSILQLKNWIIDQGLPSWICLIICFEWFAACSLYHFHQLKPDPWPLALTPLEDTRKLLLCVVPLMNY